MSTSCKIVYGYTDYADDWIVTAVYQRYMDGYPEAILPILREHMPCIIGDLEMEHTGHQFEEIESTYDGITGVDYIYYIDMSNHGKIRCTVLGFDWDFYKRYNTSNYKVCWEGVLND